MKKVCMVVYSHYPWDPRVRKEAESLTRKGYQIDVICNKNAGQKTFEIISGVNVHRLDFAIKRGSKLRYLYQYGKFFFMSRSKLNELDRKNNFDAVHVHSLPSYLVFVAGKKYGRKIILDLHESFPEIFLARFNNKLIAKFLTFVEKVSANYADEIITVSETLKKMFIERGVKKRITVLFNVPDEKLSDIKISRPAKLKNKFIINYSGTLIKERGLDVAIKAVNEIKNVIPVYLMIFGSKGEEESLKKLTRELGLEDVVYFGGTVSHHDVMKYTKMADIGILPWYSNPITEVGTPNKLFECIALEKPMIASDTKAIHDLMKDNLIYFEPGNHEELAKAILFAYNNPNELKKMTKSAHKIYQNINWSIMEKRLYNLYGDMLGKNM